MDGIFSHAASENSSISPRDLPGTRSATVLVPVENDHAFDGFTDGIHLWWPLEDFSGYGVDSHPGFEGLKLFEEAPDGRQQLWADVRNWEPPASVLMDWFLAGNQLAPTTVSVTFESVEGGTRVTLVQDGWAAGEAGWDQYNKYCDWPLILARYARFMGGAASLD